MLPTMRMQRRPGAYHAKRMQVQTIGPAKENIKHTTQLSPMLNTAAHELKQETKKDPACLLNTVGHPSKERCLASCSQGFKSGGRCNCFSRSASACISVSSFEETRRERSRWIEPRCFVLSELARTTKNCQRKNNS